MLTNPDIESYCYAHTQPVSQLLNELEAYTQKHVHGAQMLSGSLVAATLQLLVRLSGAKRVLELGTYTGYSALAMAEAMPAGGELVTIERSEVTAELAQSWFDRSDYQQLVSLQTGDIKAILPTLTGTFDLVFIDADKKSVMDYYEQVLQLSHVGTLVVVDNALQRGHVLEPQKPAHEAMSRLNDALITDERVHQVLLPVRDGLQILQVRS